MAGLTASGGKGKSKQTQTSTTSNPYAIQQYNSAVSQLGGSSYKPLTGDQISQYMDPYVGNVVDAFTRSSDQAQQMALNQVDDNAIRAGAFGGTRGAVERGVTRGQFDLNRDNVLANLYSQGFGQALGVAQQQNAAANQYPLALQALLAQMAQGTQQNSSGTTKGKTTSLGFSWAPDPSGGMGGG